jgi:excinuclease ABC subunit C
MDDFAMLKEVIKRRFGKTPQERTMPDLMIIDGGKGQLSAVSSELERLGMLSDNRPLSKLISVDELRGDLGAQNLSVLNVHEDSSTQSTTQAATEVEFRKWSNVVAMSKGRDRNAGREFFHQNGRNEFQMEKNDKLLLFLQKIRDEAHRFAITSHRKLMRKSSKKSGLDRIQGIGEKRKKILLSHFGSINELKSASEEDIAKVKGLNQKLAKVIFQYIRE